MHPYTRGSVAYGDGVSVTENPYTADTADYDEWWRGHFEEWENESYGPIETSDATDTQPTKGD